MKPEMLPAEFSSEETYFAPKAAVFFVEVNDTLAKSNIETIEDDEIEYGWDW